VFLLHVRLRSGNVENVDQPHVKSLKKIDTEMVVIKLKRREKVK